MDYDMEAAMERADWRQQQEQDDALTRQWEEINDELNEVANVEE